MPRYWYDTEFIEDGKTIDLISIGIVCEDGRELYMQSVEFEPKNANDWVKENVLSHLTLHPSSNPFPSRSPYYDQMILDWAYHEVVGGQCCTGGIDPLCPWRSRKQIKNEILAFMDIEKYGKPELWAYYADYDHVALCQLFGTMMDLPQNWPMYTRDIKQWSDQLGVHRLPEQGKGEHNALADARWNKLAWESLKAFQASLVDLD